MIFTQEGCCPINIWQLLRNSLNRWLKQLIAGVKSNLLGCFGGLTSKKLVDTVLSNAGRDGLKPVKIGVSSFVIDTWRRYRVQSTCIAPKACHLVREHHRAEGILLIPSAICEAFFIRYHDVGLIIQQLHHTIRLHHGRVPCLRRQLQYLLDLRFASLPVSVLGFVVEGSIVVHVGGNFVQSSRD